jgi:predicted secreted protein
MSANVGREFLLKKDGVVLCAGVQNKSVTINNEPVDITSDDDAGWRTLLETVGLRSIDISFSGVTKDTSLKDLVLSATGAMIEDVTIEYPDGSEIEGDFFFASLGESGEHNGAVLFDASLNSSGEMTYTPVSV